MVCLVPNAGHIRSAQETSSQFVSSWTPSPVPPRLMKTPAAVHPLPQRGEGGGNLNLLPSPPWGRGWREAPGEGVTHERIER
jgi:hypothetical protein